MTVDVLQLKLIVSIPQHIKFFNNYLSSPRANFSQQMYAVSLAQYQSLPFNSLYSSSRPLLGFKDDYIAEVTFLLIRFFNTFLKMQRMVTETVFISKKSAMKYKTYNLNHETSGNPHPLPTPVNIKSKISVTLLFVGIKNYNHCRFPGTLFPTEAPIPSPIDYSIFNGIVKYTKLLNYIMHKTFLATLLFHLEYLLYY